MGPGTGRHAAPGSSHDSTARTAGRAAWRAATRAAVIVHGEFRAEPGRLLVTSRAIGVICAVSFVPTGTLHHGSIPDGFAAVIWAVTTATLIIRAIRHRGQRKWRITRGRMTTASPQAVGERVADNTERIGDLEERADAQESRLSDVVGAVCRAAAAAGVPAHIRGDSRPHLKLVKNSDSRNQAG